MFPYPLARLALFALDPEDAHHAAFRALEQMRRAGLGGLVRQRIPDDPRTLLGLTFPNPVGLAAGLDKDGRYIDALADLGFGFLELGTVTPRPQPGNPRPRMFRLESARALINRMGFNNDGVDALVERVLASRFHAAGGIIGINLGKNADTPIERAADDYVIGLERVVAVASYVTINISSPNTANLRALQAADELDALLDRLVETRDRLTAGRRRVPLAVKIAPDLDEAQIDACAEAFLRRGVDAVIATNTTVARDTVAGLAHADEAGGLSGAPVCAASDRVIDAFRTRLQARIPIIGVGGILSGTDAQRKIESGASLIQLYTGLIYTGPQLVPECARALRASAAAATRASHAT